VKEVSLIFNPPPGWPKPPDDWQPPLGWEPDPSWPELPEGWKLWIPKTEDIKSTRENHEKHSNNTEGTSNDRTKDDFSSQIELLKAENAVLKNLLESKENNSEELVVLSDEQILQSVGIYRYHHPLENAETYKVRLKAISSGIAVLVKTKEAIENSNMFTFDNSLAKGRKMTADLGKLMLRAYNAEADNSIRSLRAGNVQTAKKRLEASRTAIAKLGAMMEMKIGEKYHALRLEEIELTSDWLMKKQEEKEISREERGRLREERRVEKELAHERERLNKERRHIINAISALKEAGESDLDLEGRLGVIDEAIAENDYRLANVRAGYVYVISNRGAFGDNVVKIGLTRRLEPLDRISELSGASVPFRFDIHALYFSEDAVTLENELHKHFANRAVNMANSRKEFFFVKPAEVRAVLSDKVGNLLEFTEKADATEYLQSTRYWPKLSGALGPSLPVSEKAM